MSTSKSVRNLFAALAISMSIAALPATAAVAADATPANMPANMPVNMPANTIVMKNFDFSPMSLTIKAGDSVTWKNLDGEPHTVTSMDGTFRSGALDQNDSYRFKFDKPGTYKYLCTIHPRMKAAIIVK